MAHKQTHTIQKESLFQKPHQSFFVCSYKIYAITIVLYGMQTQHEQQQIEKKNNAYQPRNTTIFHLIDSQEYFINVCYGVHLFVLRVHYMPIIYVSTSGNGI